MGLFYIFTDDLKSKTMKRIFFLSPAVFLLLSGILFIGCKKDKDTTPPEIKLKGTPTIYVCNGDIYNDEGATATDESDGDISSEIEVTNLVDSNINGTYYVKYNVSDHAGNKATEVVRTVIVIFC
jgi:hypothetical protein